MGEGPQAADNCMMRSCCMGVLFTGHYSKERVGGTCGTWGKTRNTVRLVDKTSEGKRTLGRPMFRWEDSKRSILNE
jgi:hypothetical protein